MNASLIVPALFFAAIALVVIMYFVRLFLFAFNGNPFRWFEGYRLRKKERLLLMANEQYKNNQFEEACQNWRAAFYLDGVVNSPLLVDAIGNHNLNILGRIVSMIEKKGAHLENLPLVEGLITSRSELAKSYIEVRNSVRKLKRNKAYKKAGSTPDWAMNEFVKKMNEIKGKLEGNRKALGSELERLFSSLKNISSSQEITYH